MPLLEESAASLRDGDTVLLCSDGLNKEVSDQEVAMILESGDCEEASQELVELTLERGARDNVTVAVIRFEATTDFKARMPDDTAVNYKLARSYVEASSGQSTVLRFHNQQHSREGVTQ